MQSRGVCTIPTSFNLEFPAMIMTDSSNEILAKSALLAQIGQDFYRRGWVLGTSGNFSAVANHDPLRLLITASGMHKGQLTAEQFVQIDENAGVLAGAGRPSDETHLHLALVRQCGAQSVLHTHSVWSAILSDAFAANGGLKISGYEMLKGLAGVRTHEHEEWLPILENSQEMLALAEKLEELLQTYPQNAWLPVARARAVHLGTEHR